MKKKQVFFVLWLPFFFFFGFLPSVDAKPTGSAYRVTRGAIIELQPKEKMEPNGEFVVSVFQDEQWTDMSKIPCDRFSRDNFVEITGIGETQNKVMIRITKEGGGAAHIDSVFLDGNPPLAEESARDVFTRGKLSKKDLDVIDAQQPLILGFSTSGKSINRLALTGRIEPEVISKTPFQFPKINQNRAPGDFVDFYAYRLGSVTRSPNVDGSIDEVSQTSPLFTEFTHPGSGHPNGYTYGWVCNDNDNLYVSLDFTPDNTMDGDLDYAKVTVKTPEGLKAYRVSVPEEQWGKPAFTYTDKVAYQHKTYEFEIPLKEIGTAGEDIQLAVAAYGTASPYGNTDPALAFDTINSRFLLVYRNQNTSYVKNIRGQFVNSDGSLYGAEFKITDTIQTDSQPSVAFNPEIGGFLVAWTHSSGNSDIYGQLVNSDGSLNGGSFAISDNDELEASPQVCYDSVNDRFVVIFLDRRGSGDSIYGQIVNSDGTLFGTTSDINFVISDTGNSVRNPLVAFDASSGRFLAAWNDDRNGNYDVYGQIMNADGTPYGTATNVNFPIANEGSHQIDPSIAYDSVNHRYLVAGTDFRNKDANSYDIYGQIINPDGSMFNTASNVNFVVCNNNGGQTSSMASYSRAQQRFLVAWQDTRGGLYGQYMGVDGTAVGTATDVNFLIVNASIAESIVEYNPSYANFLVAWEDLSNPSSIHLLVLGETSPPDIDGDPSDHNFGNIPVGSNSGPVTITVTNLGTSPLFMENLVKGGDNPGPFTIQNDNVSGQTIDPSGSKTFEVVFSSASEDEKNATITLPSNDPDEHFFVISLVGNPDRDDDGVPDDKDGCPSDPEKVDPGVCGCGVADRDTDADGTADCNDNCPSDPEKVDPGVCGCGVADTDTDADGVCNCFEGTGDRDGDGIVDSYDYDPTGYFYDELSGSIISGGKVTISGPSGSTITLIRDGSDGYYQFTTDGTAGIYTINVTLPPGYLWGEHCSDQDMLDPTGHANPYVLGNGEEGSTGVLASYECTDFYLRFDLEPGDPFIFNNNLPVRSAAIPTLSDWGIITFALLLAGLGFWCIRRGKAFDG